MNKPEIPQEALEQMTREGWATMEEQAEYWRKKDLGGNVLPDRIKANMEQYDPENFDGPEFQTLGEYETDAERNT